MKVLKMGSRGDEVLRLKRILNKVGYGLDEANPNFLTLTEKAVKAFQGTNDLKPDGEVGPKTWAVLETIETPPATGIPVTVNAPPKWYVEAKKFEGKSETDSRLAAIMVPLWATLFGRKLNSIQKYAWCGLGMAAALFWGGQSWQKGGESARAWGQYGQEIKWQRDGIPQGAIIWINHSNNCSSSSSNHVSQANGFCAAEDLVDSNGKVKSGASIGLYGANQGNKWKVSVYSAKEICAVRWPPKEPLPARVTKSVNCSGTKTDSGESTR